MPTLRRRSRIVQAPANTSNPSNDDHQAQSTQTQTMSKYEQSREERIKQNLQKLEKLGILDLSQKFNSQIRPKRTPKDPSLHKSTAASSALPPSGPTRRSSRLQNVKPISYSEVDALKKDKALLKNKDIVLEVGSKPEIYTEEHEKLLGNTEKTWLLFVDGYDNNGNRIYDPVRGKTCHQCRQKTLGRRTHCCKCKMVQGQFCGDCLYMRYGEHVFEALENPDWICPVCRGICNCSLCRKAKGWAPTGTLYKKISGLGFKSVAHYLIQTHRQETDLVKGSDTPNQVSAKSSLQFADREALSKDALKVNGIDLVSSESQFEDQSADEFKGKKESTMQNVQNEDTNYQISAKRSFPFSDMGPLSQNMGPWEVEHKVDDLFGLLKPQRENHCDDFKSEKETELNGIECFGSETAFTKLKRKPAQTIEPSMDSIAGRLSQRCKKGNGHDNDLQKPKERVLCCKQGINEIFTGMEVEQEKEQHFTSGKHDIDGDIVLDENPKMKKPSLATKLNSDSIAGRLKLRSKNHGNGGELPRVNDSILDIKLDVENVPSGKEVEKDKVALPSEIKHDDGSNTPLEHGTCGKQDMNKILTGKEEEQEKEQHFTGDKHDIDDDTLSEKNPEMKKSSLATKVNSDSIAGRLKLSCRNHDNGGDLLRVNDSISDVKQDVENVPSDKEVEKDKEILASDIKHDGGSNTPSERSPKLRHKRALANARCSDSIAGRLRQRHKR